MIVSSGKPRLTPGILIRASGVLAMAGWIAYGQTPRDANPGAPGASSGTVIAGTIAVAGFDSRMIFNAGAGNSIKLTLRDDITSSLIVNSTSGQILTLLLCQDAAGSRTIAWPANMKLSGGAFTLNGFPNKCDALTAVYDGNTWYEIARAMNE